MAEAVVSFLLERLGDFVLKEAKSFSKKANYKKIQRLKRELKRTQCILKDADTKQDQDEIICQKVAEIRDLTPDVDNIFDRCECDLMIDCRRKEGLKIFRSFFDESRTMQKLGSKIDDITECVTELITTLQAYGVEELRGGDHGGSNNSSKEKQRRQLGRTLSHVEEANIGLVNGLLNKY